MQAFKFKTEPGRGHPHHAGGGHVPGFPGHQRLRGKQEAAQGSQSPPVQAVPGVCGTIKITLNWADY